MDPRDIDWNTLWQESRRKKSWKKKKKGDWDKRAAGFAKRNIGSTYVDEFLAALKPKPEWSVLDVGAGPGTLSLPMASMVRQVTALDFSAKMLGVLNEQAREAGHENVHTIQVAWEDDWEQAGVGVHDVAIASRSLAVQDLRAALEKLNNHAEKAVFITDRVGNGPMYPALFEAIGREFKTGPDYIFTVNILYQMGIQANVNFISADRNGPFATRKEAEKSLTWMVDDPTMDEQEKLQIFINEHLCEHPQGTWTIEGKPPVRWALIWWKK